MFLSRLKVLNQHGDIVAFDEPHPEQISSLPSYLDPQVRTIILLKPRQIGATTLAVAVLFWKLYTARNGLRLLIVANDDDANDNIFQKLKIFYESLPLALQRPLVRSNRKELIFADTLAGARVITAGGRGHSRSFTYQMLLAEEFAFWPSGSSRDVWASVTSTMHQGPNHLKVILSTPNGPGNLYHEKVLQAMKAEANGDRSMAFHFFPWTDHPSYWRQPPEDWMPTPEELDMMMGASRLSVGQVYWRHWKVNDPSEGIGDLRFRKEYPLSVEDGFIVTQGSWYDTDLLGDILKLLPNKRAVGEEREYVAPDRGKRYVIGVDPSWANGGDFAVAIVLDEYGEQVSVLSMQYGGEDLFALRVRELALKYNEARIMVEANRGGAGSVVIKSLRRERANLWTGVEELSGGKRRFLDCWTTTAGRREKLLAHHRKMINQDALKLNDHITVQELIHFREESGKLQGQDGYHDDHVMAHALAEWNLRSLPNRTVRKKTNRGHQSGLVNPFERLRRGHTN